MTKIQVTLKAVLDDGTKRYEPGGNVSMDEAQAKKLAGLGMVELPQAVVVCGRSTLADSDGRAGGAPGEKKPGKTSGRRRLKAAGNVNPGDAGEQHHVDDGDGEDGDA